VHIDRLEIWRRARGWLNICRQRGHYTAKILNQQQQLRPCSQIWWAKQPGCNDLGTIR